MRPRPIALSAVCAWLGCAAGPGTTLAPVTGPADMDASPIHDHDPEADVVSVDGCVDQPETYNGYQDDDGCPDVLPARLCCATIPRIRPVAVPVGDRLPNEARAYLDQAGDFLVAHPEIRLEVVGHADALEGRGDPAAQHRLGLARAEAVRRYLVEVRRVDPAALVIRSAGADEPRDTHKTRAGRVNNRRVEFTVLDPGLPGGTPGSPDQAVSREETARRDLSTTLDPESLQRALDGGPSWAPASPWRMTHAPDDLKTPSTTPTPPTPMTPTATHLASKRRSRPAAHRSRPVRYPTDHERVNVGVSIPKVGFCFKTNLTPAIRLTG